MKHSKFLTIAVASVMAVSAFALASCNEDKPTPEPEPVAETAILKDTSIQSKIIAGYSFENGGAAINPYTGEALSQYDVTLSSSDTVDGKTGKGIASGNVSATLPKFNDAVSEEAGFSFTFMSYSEDALSDWNVLLSSDYCVITYGNLSTPSSWPSACSEIGRGAYSAEKYEEARQGLSTRQLAKWNSYAAYNAGVVEGKDDTAASDSLYNEMVGTWQVMTVVVTDDSISWYRNGALAYVYRSPIINSEADYLLVDLIDLDGGDSSSIKMFSGAGGTVDNLVFGNALSAEEVLALYNDLSGDTKTMSDVTLATAMGEEADIADAIDEATSIALAERNEKLPALIAEKRDATVVDEDTITLGAEDCSGAFWSDFKSIALDEGSSSVKLQLTQFSSTAQIWDNAIIVLYSSAGEEGVVRLDGGNWATNATDWKVETDSNFTADSTFQASLDGAEVTVTITVNEDSSITVDYVMVPVDVGEVFEASASVGNANETVTIAVEEYHIAMTVSGFAATDNVSFGLTLEGAYLVVNSIEGGSFVG